MTAAMRRAIEDDQFPHAPRVDPLRAALGKFEAAPRQPRFRRPRPQGTTTTRSAIKPIQSLRRKALTMRCPLLGLAQFDANHSLLN